MDAVTAAGLGLQVASIAFQLFAGCIEGFVMLSTAQNIGKNGSTLICMLNLEEVQLIEWARRVGLLSGDFSLDKRLNEVAVESTLRQLRHLMLDSDDLKRRYGLTLESMPVQATLQGQANPPRAIIESAMTNAISDEMRKDVMFLARITKSRNSFPKRLR